MRKQWKCVGNYCEESITKCKNGICDTTKNKFEAEKYQPEVPQVELTNLSEVSKLPAPQLSLPKGEESSYKHLTTVRKQWNCANKVCQETVTKCNNGICETTKQQFESENYQPDIPNIEKPPTDLLNLSEILKPPEIPLIDVNLPFDNSGLIYFVTSPSNFIYYWSNSKHINKKCHNKVCTITTKTCMNGKCAEKITTEVI